MAPPGPFPSANTDISLEVLNHFYGYEEPRTITVDVDCEIWTLPKSLVAEHTAMFGDQDRVHVGNLTGFSGDEEGSFILFVEFMFTGSWKDRGLPVSWDWDFRCLEQVGPVVDKGYDSGWKVKAAIAACNLANCLEARLFHNYAMDQVFHIFYNQRTPVSPDIARHACVTKDSHIQGFMYDIIIKNWNKDHDMIDTSDEDWIGFFEEEHSKFRNRFLQEVGKKTDDLALENYLMG